MLKSQEQLYKPIAPTGQILQLANPLQLPISNLLIAFAQLFCDCVATLMRTQTNVLPQWGRQLLATLALSSMIVF